MPRPKKHDSQGTYCIVLPSSDGVEDVEVVGPFGSYDEAKKVLEAFKNNPEFADEADTLQEPILMVQPVYKTLAVASVPGRSRQ
jgi:hypothetical protein